MNYMRKWPNLYLSCTAYAPKYMDPNLVAFMNTKTYRGRVLWGSDEPWFPMRRSLAEARALPARRRRDGTVPRRHRPPPAHPRLSSPKRCLASAIAPSAATAPSQPRVSEPLPGSIVL